MDHLLRSIPRRIRTEPSKWDPKCNRQCRGESGITARKKFLTLPFSDSDSGAMRGPRAAALQVPPAQQDVLRRIQRQQTADQRLVRRASILLALAFNPCVDAVARQLGRTRVTVRLWRDR